MIEWSWISKDASDTSIFQFVDFYHIANCITWAEKGSIAHCESDTYKRCAESAYRISAGSISPEKLQRPALFSFNF